MRLPPSVIRVRLHTEPAFGFAACCFPLPGWQCERQRLLMPPLIFCAARCPAFLQKNGQIFQTQGRALNEVADRNCKVIVVGNPCCTNALIAMENAPNLPRK